MMTICEDCGKNFEAQEQNSGIGTCYSCSLAEITNGRPPEIEDITTACFVSREMTKDEWREFQAELRRYHPGDFLTEEDEACRWCYHEGYQGCRCHEREQEREEDARRDAEQDFENSYWEAVEEDQARSEVTEREAEQARWDTEIAEQEAQHAIWEQEAAARDALWAREEEENAAFSFFWYRVVGFKIYYRFVSPILVGIMRFKKRWRQ